MTYEELLIKSEQDNLIVKEKDIPGYDGRIYKNRIAIHKGLHTQIEKACTLAEERGHHFTTTGNIMDQNDIRNQKQEGRARLWAYNEMVGLLGLIRAYEHGCTSRFEIADFLGVTEQFLEDCIQKYKSKYGICTTVDNYTVYFEPVLMIGKRTE